MKSLTEILGAYPIHSDIRRQLSEELAGMEGDAGRYGYLRNDPPSELCVRYWAYLAEDNIYVDGFNLDMAIDAAIAEVSQ